MLLTSVVFGTKHQPDFETLKANGWSHPIGLRNELLQRSLEKTFPTPEGTYTIQLVNHQGAWNYTEAYIFARDQGMQTMILHKGEGGEMSCETACYLIHCLYDALEIK